MATIAASPKDHTLISLLLGAAAVYGAFSFFPPLIFFAVIPLFRLYPRRNFWLRFGLTLLFLLFSILLLVIPRDLFDLTYASGALVALTIAFGISAPIYAFPLAYGKSPFAQACGWTVAHSIVSSLALSIPFPAESALVPYPVLIQSAGLFGPYLICFLIIYANAALACSRKIPLHLILLFASALIFGLAALRSAPPSGPAIRLSIVQPNLSSRELQKNESSAVLQKISELKLLWLSKKAAKDSTEMVAWPEQSVNYILQNDGRLRQLRAELKVELLAGTEYINYGAGRKRYNIAFVLRKDGSVSDPYEKTNLFPIAESGFYTRGERSEPIESGTALRKIGAMICLESVFPGKARYLTERGASALFLLGNDAAFGRSLIPCIHRDLLALRAVENNRYAVHISNTGPSAVFDNKGRMLCRSAYGQATFITGDVAPIAKKTFSANCGDWFVLLCLIVLARINFRRQSDAGEAKL